MKAVRVKKTSNEVLQKAFQNLRHQTELNEEEVKAMESFADEFVTCSLCTGVVGEEAAARAENFNWHGHSQTCFKKHCKLCRFGFPRFPLARTIFIDAHKAVPKEKKLDKEVRNEILRRVRSVLTEEKDGKIVVSEAVHKIMQQYENVKTRQDSDEHPASEIVPTQEGLEPREASEPIYIKDVQGNKVLNTNKKMRGFKLPYVNNESPEEYDVNIKARIEEVLKIASAGGDPISYEQYERAVCQQPRKGSTTLLRRDISECFVNNYNVEWIEAWDANLDLSPVNDFFGAITYITDYWAKDSTGLTNVLKTAMKELKNQEDMRQKCYELADVFLSHRQVGEAEIFYKLLPHMHLVVSSIATVYVPTEPKRERRQFLQRQDPDEGKGFKVKDKEGLFLEKPDIISKYERRKLCGTEEEEEDDDCLEELCLSQFVKMYEGRGYKPKMKTNEEGEREEQYEEEEGVEEGQLAEEDMFNYVIVGDEKVTKLKKLPAVITLSDLMTGEPPLLQKRSFPRSLRYFKKNLTKDPHAYYLSELYLYHPFRDESELFPDDPIACEELYRDNEAQIKRRKAQIMPFLESVEEAQLMYEQSKDDEEDVLDDIGAELDPENEQEVGEVEDEGILEHPEYAHLDPDEVDDNAGGNDDGKFAFKTINIPDPDVQLHQARKLDCWQKEVLRLGVGYCRQIVKYRRNGHEDEKPVPPLVMVHGGAGSGKSTVIHLLSVMMQKILQQPGDDPTHPCVLLTSFTGAAAANINGLVVGNTMVF